METGIHTIIKDFAKMYSIPCYSVDIDLSHLVPNGDFYTNRDLGIELGRYLNLVRRKLGTEAGGRTNFFKNNKEFWHWEVTTSSYSEDKTIYIISFWFKDKKDAIYFKMRT